MAIRGLENEYHLKLYKQFHPPLLAEVHPYWEPPVDLIPEDTENILRNPQSEAQRLMDHPAVLTYMSLLDPELIDLKYPAIFEGIYLPIRVLEPSAATADMMKYCGAKDSDDLVRRTKNIVKAVLSKAPKHSLDNIDTAFDFMAALYGNETRNTGEKKICHEARTLLDTLVQLIDYHETTLIFSYSYYPKGYHPTDPLSPLNQAETAARCAGIVLHDSREDFFDNEIAFLGADYDKGPPYVITLEYEGRQNFLILNTIKEMESILYFIDALTNREMDKRFDDKFVTEENIIRIIGTMLDLGFDMSTKFLRQTINDGKISDRNDNVKMLWRHPRYGPKGDLYHLKLVETLTRPFQLLAASAWGNRHSTEVVNNLGYVYREPYGSTWLVNYINDVPLAISVTLLKSLGTTDEDIFGWTTKGNSKKVFDDLEKEGEEPLLIPSPTQADILTKTGRHIAISRNGNPDVVEVVKRRYLVK